METIKDLYLLAYSIWLAQLALTWSLDPPVWGWYLPQSEVSSCSNWQLKRCCTDIATGQFGLENSSLETFSSLVTLGLCLVDICNYRSLESVRRESPFPLEGAQLRVMTVSLGLEIKHIGNLKDSPHYERQKSYKSQ